MASTIDTVLQRRLILVQGIVQGVGFRPFVYNLAIGLGLVGSVRNDSHGVTIEIEGTSDLLALFEERLRSSPPPLARITHIAVQTIPPRCDTTFAIHTSQAQSERSTLIAPDSAICADCLSEIRDPANRRYGYAFTNCTNCGPRFTIVRDIPYDRPLTTMNAFPMCPACQREYEDPTDRRFHAQPNACPVCGPRLVLLRENTAFEGDAIQEAAHLLAQGAILAIKGLGGYHLACDAMNNEAVARLRARKHREAKPFALMVPDLTTATSIGQIDATTTALLTSRHRPIVLIDQHTKTMLAPAIAPGYFNVGVMLPYTPLHYLLFDAYQRAIGNEPAILVMTSGNLSDEPIAYCDDDARARLGPLAEGILTHNRAIHIRCDDSVVRVSDGATQFLRRSRSYAPEPLTLARPVPQQMLATGAHLKNTFAVAREYNVFLSHHIGDLENLETLTSFREGIAHFTRIFAVEPTVVAYDLHPEYLATKYAIETPIATKIAVQHHHAHIASVLAEQQLEGQVIGVAADGTGYGTDGAIWGGEILIADCASFDRYAHLEYVPLPGGDQAVRQPWRLGAVYLQRAFGEDLPDTPLTRTLDFARWRVIQSMLTHNVNCPLTSSLGRLFDAAAAIIGLRGEVVYEGQAAIELEALAQGYGAEEADDGLYPYALHSAPDAPHIIATSPLIRALVIDWQAGSDLAAIAWRFHASIARMIAQMCQHAADSTGLRRVALSGGVFQNRLLLQLVRRYLIAADLTVYTNQQVPPNDGGISLGQIAVAAAQLQSMGGQ